MVKLSFKEEIVNADSAKEEDADHQVVLVRVISCPEASVRNFNFNRNMELRDSKHSQQSIISHYGGPSRPGA